MAQMMTTLIARKGAIALEPRMRRVDMTPSKVMVTRSPRQDAIGGAMLSEEKASINTEGWQELASHQGHDRVFDKEQRGNT